MSSEPDDPQTPSTSPQNSFRRQAEARFAALPPLPVSTDSVEALQREVEIQKLELEMQAEMLRRTRAALLDSRNRFQDAYESAPFGFVTLTRDGRITQLNPAAAAILGLGADAPGEARAFAQFLDAESEGDWSAFLPTLPGAETRRHAEFRLARDSDAGPIHVRVEALRARGDGDLLTVLVALVDVSEEKRIQNTLREHDEFSRLISENMDGFIAVVDTEGRRLYNSPSYAQLLGERPLVDSDSFADVHPDDRERVAAAFRETLAGGFGQHLEYRFVRHDGKVRTLESQGGVIRDSGGTIKCLVVVSHDVTERKEAAAKIHRLAYYDALTQLPNRRLLNDRLHQAMAAGKRNGRFGAVLLLDLDHFKLLNDRHGHGVGDRLLVQAAARISGRVREMDTVARFGGDEFVVVLGELGSDHGESIAQAKMVAEKIGAALAEPYVLELGPPSDPDDESESAAEDGNDPAPPAPAWIKHSCTASIGVALFLGHKRSVEEVIRLADVAMYRAKDDGRDRIRFAHDYR